MRKIMSYTLTALLIMGLIVIAVPIFTPITATADADNWTLTTGAREMKVYPDLREYIWQKNASMPPHTAYDKVGLHRLVNPNTAAKAVVLLLPEWSSSGANYISNPSTDNWVKLENNSQAIYWANRGFDVYCMDYRTHFIPNTMNASQLEFMKDYGWDMYVSDTKEVVDKVKEISGASKIFIVGYSQGAAVAMNYATKYWKTDLQGLILESAYMPSYAAGAVSDTPVASKRGNETNTFNMTSQLNYLATTGNWSIENLPLATILVMNYSLNNPGAPAEYPPGTPLPPTINPLTNKTWTNITERNAVSFYSAGFSNTIAGLGNVTLVEHHWANGDRWVPSRIYIESKAMVDWVNCPYLTYDYDDHYSEIGVPLLAFNGALYSNRTGTFRYINGLNTTDFTGIMLPNYGHYDVFFGTRSARDVSQPSYNWIINHTPTPTPSASPTTAPTPTPTTAPTTTPKPGQTNQPTPPPTVAPTLTPDPASPDPTIQPTASPNANPFAMSMEVIFAIITIVAVALGATAVLLLKKQTP
jgi:pimeloyl-ACP methyl ester carboxylesterase